MTYTNEIEKQLASESSSQQLPNGMHLIDNTWLDDLKTAARLGGAEEVVAMYDRAYKNWHRDIRHWTAFSVALNHASWYYEDDAELSEVFAELYYKSREIVVRNKDNIYSKEEIMYYALATD